MLACVAVLLTCCVGIILCDRDTDKARAIIEELNLNKRMEKVANLRDAVVKATGFDPPTEARVCLNGVGVCLVAKQKITDGEQIAALTREILIDRSTVQQSSIGAVAKSQLSTYGVLAAYVLHCRSKLIETPAVHRAYVAALPIEAIPSLYSALQCCWGWG